MEVNALKKEEEEMFVLLFKFIFNILKSKNFKKYFWQQNMYVARLGFSIKKKARKICLITYTSNSQIKYFPINLLGN